VRILLRTDRRYLCSFGCILLYVNALWLTVNVRESLEIAIPHSCRIRDCSRQLAPARAKIRGTIANGRSREGNGCVRNRGAARRGGKEKSRLKGEIYERRVPAR